MIKDRTVLDIQNEPHRICCDTCGKELRFYFSNILNIIYIKGHKCIKYKG
jgi:hypothetical protein